METYQNSQKFKNVLNKILAHYPVAFAYIYGSTVKGQTHPESDIDIALGFSKAVSDDLFYKIFNDLCLGLKIPSEKLDLKNFEELPLAVRFRVIRDGKMIYLKDVKTHRKITVKTLDYYYDEEPFFQYSMNEFFKNAASK